jgi:hypothetical protein
MTIKTRKPRQSKKLSKLIENPFVRSTWADYADSLLKPKYYVNRFDDKKGNRFYYFKKEDKVIIAAGATTVWGEVSTDREGINRWKEAHSDWRHLLDISSEYGSMEHSLFGDIMFQKGVSKSKITAMQDIVVAHGGNPNMPAKDVLSFLKFQEDYQLKPLLIEASLVWQDPISGEWLAMTIDLLAEMVVPNKVKKTVEDGVYQRGDNKGQPKFKEITEVTYNKKIVLADFKGNFFQKDFKSFYETNRLQLQSAKLAVEQNFGITVDECYNWTPTAWRTAPDYKFYKHEFTEKDWNILKSYWGVIIAKDINKPEGSFLETTFKDSNDYKFYSYQEYVEQVLMNPAKA